MSVLPFSFTVAQDAGDIAVDFLEMLRPGGPWVLSANVPDNKAWPTITAKTPEDVRAFIRKHEGKRNLYYSVNPTRTEMSDKAAKTDIAAIEYLQADLDPRAGETPEAAKKRYLEQLETFEPKATGIIISGSGIHGLRKLQDRIDLGKPVNGKFAPEDQAKVEDVEARSKALMEQLGSKAGTQDICRVLRLPGTTNLPNAAKRKAGRVQCPAKLLCFDDDVAHPLSAFPKASKNTKKAARKAERGEDKLARYIRERGVPFGERSERVWYAVNEMLRRGYRASTIEQVLLDRANGISEHVHDQAKPQEYAGRQVQKAIENIDFIRNKKDEIIRNNTVNIRIALLMLDVSVRYDQFADRTLIEGLPGFGPALEDAAVHRLWLLFMERLYFSPDHVMLRIVLNDMARLNGFHPVRDYLNGLRWDGVPRLESWLIVYAGAEDTEYTRAVGALVLIAAVRRVRQPGCKFDEMLVLEQSAQGTDKSSALAVLAGNEEWFTDDLPLHVEGKRVIETLRGRWIVEAAELSGMRRADVEHLKALLSRRIDRGRMAYGRLPIEAARECIIIGTTNKSEYLRDTSGNRRFWPVLIKRFDLAALRRDRDQLWAEACVREAAGASIRLAPELWPEAAKEQRQRLANDPFVELLRRHLGDLEGRIRATDVWEILDVRGAQLTQDIYQRASAAMREIGWGRPNKAGHAKFGGKVLQAYVRGDRRKVITVSRDHTNLFIMAEDEK